MTAPAAVRAMLEARTVAVVGASAREGSFGQRMVTEVTRGADRTVHLVNPRYDRIGDRRCLPSLAEVPEPVDLVLMGVRDAALEAQVALAAARGDRGAVVYGSVHGPAAGGGQSLAARIAKTAAGAGMALCGGGCMGFANVGAGLRALGYLERDPLPAGPVALVSHSGSAFSALLRARRGIGWTLAVSSGQELVTTTADYLEHALDVPGTEVVALLLETVREPARLRAALARAADRDVPVVLLAVGGSPVGRGLVAAHSGAVAGDDAGWEALCSAYGLLRVHDLAELTDTLELLAAGRRVRGASGGGVGAGVGIGIGIGTVHDSGAERTLVADTAHAVGVPFAELGPATVERLGGLLDPGLVPHNPLDVWGTGAETRALFTGCLDAMADDPAVAAVVLAVDLVEEYDGDESYPLAALDAAARTGKPVAVLANLASAVDQGWAGQLRERGVPVLEGTRSGLVALGHLLRAGNRPPRAAAVVDEARRVRWAARLAGGPLGAAESFALLADYGVPVVAVEEVAGRAAAVAAAERVGWPVVLKTAEPEIAHKSDVGGVVLGLPDAAAVAAAYDDLSARLGPRVLVSVTAAPGVELVLGLARDPLLGPLVVVGAGGVLVELLGDRAVGLPPLTAGEVGGMLDRLAGRPLLDGWRGAPPVDRGALVAAVLGVAQLAVELGEHLDALDVNPVVAGPAGCTAVDVLVVPRPA